MAKLTDYLAGLMLAVGFNVLLWTLTAIDPAKIGSMTADQIAAAIFCYRPFAMTVLGALNLMLLGVVVASHGGSK